MLRTIELILGLPPMSQYDAAATPMWRSFTSTLNLTPFIIVPANIDLNQVNMKATKSALKSSTLNFTQADKIDDRMFNEILYKGIKGENTTVPVPHRSAFIKAGEKDDKD
ncbi:MAG: beta-propeller repeat protein [Mucilaginibacter sp.]|nr:beta-propeller repeat protein [Mucilaginibacter sp.]